MHFKRKIQKLVYKLYLKGTDIITIASFLDMNTEDINEIIDYLNEYHY